MKRVRWSPAAADDLEDLRDYLRINFPSFADSTVRKIYDAARSLKRHSNRGRVGRREGTRELVLTPLPFIVVYSVNHSFVHILRVLHAARDWEV